MVCSHRWGQKVGLALVHFSPQDWVSLDWVGQFRASQPFQYLIISIMNGWTRFRFEFIMYNHHHILLFDWWGGDKFGSKPQRFTPRLCVFGLIKEYHSISTLSTSHYKYNEWCEKAEIGIWALNWLPQRVFQSPVGSKLAWPFSTFHPKIQWVWTDWGNSQHLNPFNFSL